MINLQKVYDWLRNNLETSYDRVIFLGDFNAGGSYFKVGVDEYKVPFLYHNPAIRQYITGNTNIKNDEPYDKIAVSSCIFRKDYLNEPQVFDFKTKLYPKQLPDVRLLDANLDILYACMICSNKYNQAGLPRLTAVIHTFLWTVNI